MNVTALSVSNVDMKCTYEASMKPPHTYVKDRLAQTWCLHVTLQPDDTKKEPKKLAYSSNLKKVKKKEKKKGQKWYLLLFPQAIFQWILLSPYDTMQSVILCTDIMMFMHCTGYILPFLFMLMTSNITCGMQNCQVSQCGTIQVL